MSTFTKTQIKTQINSSIDNIFNIPHSTIWNTQKDFFENKIQGIYNGLRHTGNIYQLGYFVLPYGNIFSTSITTFGNGDMSYNINQRLESYSESDLYHALNVLIDEQYSKLNPSFAKNINFFNTIKHSLGSRVCYQISYLLGFDTNDFVKEFAYFGIGGINNNNNYSNFFIIRMKKTTLEIDKILFIKEKSVSQYLSDYENEDWDSIANPDPTNYIFQDYSSQKIKCNNLLNLCIVYDNIERKEAFTEVYNYILDAEDSNGYCRLIINGQEIVFNNGSDYIQPIINFNSNNQSMRFGFGCKLNIELGKTSNCKVLTISSQRIMRGVSK